MISNCAGTVLSVLWDLAVMRADSGETICGIDVLRHQVNCSVASPATFASTAIELRLSSCRRLRQAAYRTGRIIGSDSEPCEDLTVTVTAVPLSCGARSTVTVSTLA